MYDIQVHDEQQILEIPVGRITKVIHDVLSHELVESAEISIAFIDSQTMRRLNNSHLGHDFDTDVLSFLLESTTPESMPSESMPSESMPSELTPAASRGAGKRIEGEVLVSPAIAIEAARQYHWEPTDETLLYVVHGVLHLLGYDDLTDEEREVMVAAESRHLARWGLVPPGRAPERPIS